MSGRVVCIVAGVALGAALLATSQSATLAGDNESTLAERVSHIEKSLREFARQAQRHAGEEQRVHTLRANTVRVRRIEVVSEEGAVLGVIDADGLCFEKGVQLYKGIVRATGVEVRDGCAPDSTWLSAKGLIFEAPAVIDLPLGTRPVRLSVPLQYGFGTTSVLASSCPAILPNTPANPGDDAGIVRRRRQLTANVFKFLASVLFPCPRSLAITSHDRLCVARKR